ncbi:hypothetical protein [Coralloluteibacterium thermophilus]|uniref:AI-2E family transporter n=1 Tax=Coralloluteibacterium thermophilum TaxID=2707049 RepID=A0ABV9NNI8_9GAMM
MTRDPRQFDPASRRSGVRRTVLVVAAVAVAIYLVAILRTFLA